jgi:hypothetical protein
MTRKDTYLDAMLRHLGVAYYESLHGSATRADAARALDTVEERLGEAAREPEPGAEARCRKALASVGPQGQRRDDDVRGDRGPGYPV